MQELPEGFDLAVLLAPISGETPAGQDLREDKSPESLYFRLRDARREARAAERAADAPKDDSDPRPVDAAPVSPILQWRVVRELATEALTLHSKDLEIAAWLTEALLRDAGLNGLTAGFRLLAGLAEELLGRCFSTARRGGDRHPCRAGGRPQWRGPGGHPDPAAAEDRSVRKAARQLTVLVLAIRAVAGNRQQRQCRTTAAAVRGRRLPPFEAVENEASLARHVSPNCAAKSHEAAEAWQALGQVLEERAGADAPPTSQIRDLLEKVRFAADRLAGPHQNAEAETPAAATSMPSAPPGGAAAGAPATTGLASREEALRALAQIADFFRRTEPLSPITYTLQEAVRRGRMTWPELLEEIVPDPMSRSAILSSLGIRPPPSE